jgi:hypothetical protein
MILDGYIRVSDVRRRSGERFISPVVQREQIERWAKLRGALIGHVFEELDESGGRRDRPLLMEAVERVERGESDGLVVAYLSRFGRSQLDGLTTIHRITRAGGPEDRLHVRLDDRVDDRPGRRARAGGPDLGARVDTTLVARSRLTHRRAHQPPAAAQRRIPRRSGGSWLSRGGNLLVAGCARSQVFSSISGS